MGAIQTTMIAVILIISLNTIYMVKHSEVIRIQYSIIL